MGKDVIVALDFDSKEKTLAFLDRFTEEKPCVKIGMELFYAEGPSIVREIRARGHKIFLDLKLHDIPNTVKKATAALSALDVDLVNVHAAGTGAMMSAALAGLTRPDGTRPLLIAVTQLTSTDQDMLEKELWIEKPMEEVVLHYAEIASIVGLDGVVCSPLEAGGIHERCGKNFLTVTPGVRVAGGDAGDQKRVTTPAKAKELGINTVYSELLPGDKVSKVEELLDQKHTGKLAFVGDGINDAPVLSRADIGIAMGAMGSDAAIEAADVVLMDDDPMKIAKAIRISRKCLRIVHENIVFAIGIKLLCLLLGALGIANMWAAIFADVGVMVLAVLNAIRALMVKNL